MGEVALWSLKVFLLNAMSGGKKKKKNGEEDLKSEESLSTDKTLSLKTLGKIQF